ncbi:MAG: CopD family protein [Gammaproteobacteria bacterium]
MYFWLKFFHIAAVATWFAGLVFLPRVFIGGATSNASLGRLLYKGVMTPAAAVAVTLGMTLILVYGFEGAWLPMKLVLVATVVLLHAYLGFVLHRLEEGDRRHGPFTYRVLTWVPLALFLAIAALTAAKPVDLNLWSVHTPQSDGGM